MENAAAKPASEECGICLDALTNPVSLPCTHKFCDGCLQSWRSKYDHRSDKTCPMCRKVIPPTKEMLSQRNSLRTCIKIWEKEGRDPDERLKAELMRAELEEMEEMIGDSDVLDDVALPEQLTKAAAANDLRIILEWLGPQPIDQQRLNAKDPQKMYRTLLHEAVFEGRSALISILMQFGANVDPGR